MSGNCSTVACRSGRMPAMVDPGRDLPPDLRPPFAGDRVSVTFRAEVGTLARAGEVARHLEDLDTVISTGERWGGRIARAAAYRGLVDGIVRRGPGEVEEAALQSGFRPRDLAAVEEWIHTGWWPWRPGQVPYRDPAEFVQALADYRVPEQLGTPVRLRRVTYQNPLEVVLTGSGFLIAGAIYVLRMIRDWSSNRRMAAAAAEQAEAAADVARAQAAQTRTEGDILRWFADEARAGRWHVPPGELLDLVRREDITAMERLSATPVQLDLPRGLDNTRPDPE